MSKFQTLKYKYMFKNMADRRGPNQGFYKIFAINHF